MSSKSMASINMSPEDFVRSDNIQHKAMLVEDLIEDGLDFSPQIGDWLKNVLALEVKQGGYGLSGAPAVGPQAEYLIRLVKGVAKDVHRQDIREMLGRMYRDSIERNALHYALEACMITGIDDVDDVRQWSLANLRAKGRISESTDMQALLVDLLTDDQIPYYLKQDTAPVLGATGTGKAITTLAHLAAKLILDPGKSPYDQAVSNALKQSVAQGLGLTGDEGAVRRLTALQIFCDDMDVKNAARSAIERIRMSAEKDRQAHLVTGRCSVFSKSDASRRYKIAASDFRKTEIILAADETGSYEFELDTEAAPARIFLHSTTEASVPGQIRLTLFTTLEDSPKIECILQRRSDDLEMYGYLDVKLAPDSIKRIKVVPQ